MRWMTFGTDEGVVLPVVEAELLDSSEDSQEPLRGFHDHEDVDGRLGGKARDGSAPDVLDRDGHLPDGSGECTANGLERRRPFVAVRHHLDGPARPLTHGHILPTPSGGRPTGPGGLRRRR